MLSCARGSTKPTHPRSRISAEGDGSAPEFQLDCPAAVAAESHAGHGTGECVRSREPLAEEAGRSIPQSGALGKNPRGGKGPIEPRLAADRRIFHPLVLTLTAL